MKALLISTFSLLAFAANAQVHYTLLPNGWSLSPAGKSLPLGDLPLNIAVSGSQRLLAVTNNGESTQSIELFDAVGERLLDSVSIPKSWLGLKFSADEKFLYASGGNDNRILKYSVATRKLILQDSFLLGPKWPTVISPAGLDIDDAAQKLYVVTKENNSLYTIDLHRKKVDSLKLGAEAYTCLLSPDKKTLYISLWGGAKVLLYSPAAQKITGEVAVGSNPNDLCLSANGHWLYVANANDNSVSVINTATRKVIETLNTALYPNAPSGSTPNGLALSADGRTLFIANADNNCLAVFDVSVPGESKSQGFIPVGWYPTCVRVVNHKIFVANGKAFSSLPNPGYDPFRTHAAIGYQKGNQESSYIGGLLRGTLSIINVPSAAQLQQYSKQVYANTPFHKTQEHSASGEVGNPIPQKVGAASPIKYVFYIVKENRTYDQVLGDVTGGNGDTSLVLFGKNITPNQHKLVNDFVLLDNFYVDAEVSEDGHNWSMGAYATDFLEKSWPTFYGDRGGFYDGEGTRKVANDKMYIWDDCKRAGVSYRTYGEFADDYKANIPALQHHLCPYYTGWDLSVRDTVRYGQWRREFDSLLAQNAVPHFNSLRFSNDHTSGLGRNKPSPFAQVADNDLAVGMFIQHLSESPIWKESAVFILEDDAQDGPDHVDAHRSTAYVAGGFVKRGYVDHTMYSTSSMLRTMELILGLPPMSQYDAAATPMWKCFSSSPALRPFVALPETISLDDRNTASNLWQQKSESFDLSKEDRVPDELLTESIWKAVKGADAKVPAVRHAAFVAALAADKD